MKDYAVALFPTSDVPSGPPSKAPSKAPSEAPIAQAQQRSQRDTTSS